MTEIFVFTAINTGTQELTKGGNKWGETVGGCATNYCGCWLQEVRKKVQIGMDGRSRWKAFKSRTWEFKHHEAALAGLTCIAIN